MCIVVECATVDNHGFELPNTSPLHVHTLFGFTCEVNDCCPSYTGIQESNCTIRMLIDKHFLPSAACSVVTISAHAQRGYGVCLSICSCLNPLVVSLFSQMTQLAKRTINW